MNAVTTKNTAYTRAPIKSAALKLGALTICLTAACQVASQEQPDSNANSKNRTTQTPSLETVVVTAPATKDERVSIESKTPVDTLTHEAIDSVASSDLNDKLTRLVPSYQVQRNTISNGNIFTRTATLRNLSPEHTLILVDGKRRHRSAYVDVTQLGAQAVDVSQIPSIVANDESIKRFMLSI